MIKVVACQCGSSDSLVRTRLERYHYKDFLNIPIVKGKEKSLAELNTIPQFEEIQLLRNHLKGASKWAVVIGYDNRMCRWVDLAYGKAIKNNVDLQLLLEHFA